MYCRLLKSQPKWCVICTWTELVFTRFERDCGVFVTTHWTNLLQLGHQLHCDLFVKIITLTRLRSNSPILHSPCTPGTSWPSERSRCTGQRGCMAPTWHPQYSHTRSTFLLSCQQLRTEKCTVLSVWEPYFLGHASACREMLSVTGNTDYHANWTPTMHREWLGSVLN